MIESYKFGRIVIDGNAYNSDVIVFPERVEPDWWRETGHSLSIKDLVAVFKFGPETLIVGAGYSSMMKIPASTKNEIELKGMELICADTSSAVETFNRLSGTKIVIGAFHLTC